MSGGRPDVKAIFTGALERPPGPDRAAYLDAACGGDAALRGRVEELLAALEHASDVLGRTGPAASGDSGTTPPLTDPDTTALTDPPTPAADAGATIHHHPTPPPAEAPTAGPVGDGDGLAPGASVRYFGDYEVRRELGRGGMGVVYEARQVSLNRHVALKMVRAGLLAGEDELRRFQNEAEAVALLDHPGVVPVYEVGEHDGQRYFSMKLVEGGSLVPLLDRYKDDPKASARLVAEAAEAVAHAHTRGILHRDLKPANILVDAEGHPHVTDFGLARRVEDDQGMTLSGAIFGTPAYMSPEQAAGRRGGITTATDVYGLGAVLYALLTGKAPFGGDSVVATLDAVRTAPPEPPTRVNGRVPRDLGTICLKCLEKDPRRRYATAQALADDLRAWLDSRPIAARRVGPAERAWLWCRRRPAVAALAAAVVLAVVGGTAATIAVQARANRALEDKNAELTDANSRINRERDRAEANYRRARAAVDEYFTTVSQSKLLDVPGLQPLRKELLESARRYYEDFLRERADDPSVRAEAAAALTRVGEVTGLVDRGEEALPTYGRAITLYQNLIRDRPGETAHRSDLAYVCSSRGLLLSAPGRRDEALRDHEKALALRDELARASPRDANFQADLARSHMHLGNLLSNAGKFAEAEGHLQRARSIDEAILRDSPPPGGPRHHLSGRLDAATIAREDLGDCLSALAGLYRESGRFEQAIDAHRRACELYESLLRRRPGDPGLRSYLAYHRNNLALTLINITRIDEAREASERAVGVLEALVAENPSVGSYRYGLADACITAGFSLERSDRGEEALRSFRRAAELAEALVAADPSSASNRLILGMSLTYMGRVHRGAGRTAEAVPLFRRSIRLLEGLAREIPQEMKYPFELAMALRNLARAERDDGHPAEALAAADRAGELDAALSDVSVVACWNLAIDLALAAGVAGPDRREAYAAASVEAFRRSHRMGYPWNAPGMKAEAANPSSDLHVLHDRDDFRGLIMDVAFPAQPFAR